MKKYKILILFVILVGLFTCTTSFCADTDSDVIVSLQINNPIMKVNGQNAEIDQGRSTKPVIVSGRTLVPIRAIIEAFGGDVNWNAQTRTVSLDLNDDTIKLTIDSKTAYLNSSKKTLDVAPEIINGRTMLPIRFVAEGFNLGVAWDERAKTVYVIRNLFDDDEYNRLMKDLPKFSGKAYAVVNNNVPYFEDYEIINGSFEYYASLDNLGRCDVCFASIATDIMPTEKRGDISSVKPTGWINVAYDNVDGRYLYNRCHLIGFQLTGENANKRNLITGTRYMNTEGMLPFENLVDDYIEDTGNRVMYRATPVFSGNNLVADGVLMEAYSVEDNGRGVSFCVFCYNVQPDITIDYLTGKSYLTQSVKSEEIIESDFSLWATPTGKRYHLDADCGGKNSFVITYSSALERGLTPCKKCAN